MNAQAPMTFEDATNLGAEQALLGAILFNNDAIEAVNEIGFDSAWFSEPLNRDIFEAARAQIASGKSATPITLRRFLPADDPQAEVTVAQYLARLVAEGAPISMAREYALEVLDSFATRRAAQTLDDYVGAFLSRKPGEGITDLVSKLEDDLGSIRALSPSAAAKRTLSGVMQKFLQDLSEGRRREGRVIPFPLPEIADVLQEEGFQVGNLYGLLGSSGEGKTSLMLQCARRAADNGNPVLLLSYDQSDEQVLRQMVSQATGISVSQMIRHSHDRPTLSHREFEMIADAGAVIERLPLTIQKLTNQKIGGILSKARNWAKGIRKTRRPDGTAWGAPLIILDHNRKVTPEDPRAHEGRIAGAVNGAGKAMAEELGAAVLFLNQRNSKGGDRKVPRPIAADLFGGEQAKEDYDAILSIYRPERWRDEALSVAADAKEAGQIRERFKLRSSFEDPGKEPEGMAEIGAVKVRYGASNVRAELKFEGRYTRYASTRDTGPELF